MNIKVECPLAVDVEVLDKFMKLLANFILEHHLNNWEAYSLVNDSTFLFLEAIYILKTGPEETNKRLASMLEQIRLRKQ